VLKYFIFLWWYFVLPGIIFCQKDRIQNLPEVEIHPKAQGSLIQGFMLKSDSNRFKHLASLNLPEYLLRESFLNLRSYGPGMVSSIASQGGSASQFQVLWNGIPVNHLMLGQTDASTLPLPLISNIQLMSGQNSLSFGSGAMSGQLLLQSFNLANDTSNSFAINHALNSLKVNQTAIQLGFNKTNIHVFKSGGQNRYAYTKENAQITARQPIHQTGLNAHRILLFRNHQIVTDLLFNQSKRYIGNYARGIFDSTQKMQDVLFLPSVHHFFYTNTIRLENKVYFNFSGMNYRNTLSDINSISEIRRGGSIHQLSLSIQKLLFRWKAESHLAEIRTNNYTEIKNFHYFNFGQIIGYSFLKNRLIAEAGTRLDYYPISNNFPFTYYTGLKGYAFSFLKYYIKYSTSFRHPTANELFWNPGGNPNLKPETSEGAEAGLDMNIIKNKIQFTSNMEFFNRITNNNILWTPGASGFPTPVNIQKVWNRGLLSKSTLLYYAKKYFYISLQSITAYVLSTILETEFDNSENLQGRQLIYTPRYKFNHSLSIVYKEFSFCLWHQYTGYRFTTSDNSQWLKPFHLWDISVILPSLNKERKMALETSFMIQNIFNMSYAFIAGYPMPGRIYQISIKLNYQTHKNQRL
jgi:iron complex outermembrane receptor protein